MSYKKVNRERYHPPILQRLQKLDHHNIHTAHLMFTVIKERVKEKATGRGFYPQTLSINREVIESPASLAYFTIGQLQQVLTRVIQEPEKEVHYFIFNRIRIRVKPYLELPEKDSRVKPKTKDTTTTEGLISEVIN